MRVAALQLVVERTKLREGAIIKVKHHDVDEPFNNNALSPFHSNNVLTEEEDAVFESTTPMTKRRGMNLEMETVILDDNEEETGTIDNGSPWSKHGGGSDIDSSWSKGGSDNDSPWSKRDAVYGSDNESMWSKRGSPRTVPRDTWSVSSQESYPNSPEQGAITASKAALRNSLPHSYANVRQVQKATKKCYHNYVDVLCDIRDPRERAVKAKQLYVELCRHMPAYSSKVFQVKELSGNRIRKKVSVFGYKD